MTAEEKAFNYASTQKCTKLQVGEIAKHYNNGYQQSLKDFLEKAEKYLVPHIQSILLGDMHDTSVFVQDLLRNGRRNTEAVPCESVEVLQEGGLTDGNQHLRLQDVRVKAHCRL